MKLILIICCAFFMNSCIFNEQSHSLKNNLESKIFAEWIYVEKFTAIANLEKPIERPQGIEQLIFFLDILSPKGSHYLRHCVYYKVPYKDIKGVFKVTNHNSLKECSENSDNQELFAEWSEIDHLHIIKNRFSLQIKMKIKNEVKEIEIPFYNLSDGKIHKKYLEKEEIKRLRGFKLLRLGEESFEESKSEYIGNLSDRFSKNSALRCHHVNSNCETVGENRCHSCQYGWYEVSDYQCPQGGSKFCGQNHCGEKNEPACPRSQDASGICQADLSPVRNSEGILVCQ